MNFLIFFLFFSQILINICEVSLLASNELANRKQFAEAPLYVFSLISFSQAQNFFPESISLEFVTLNYFLLNSFRSDQLAEMSFADLHLNPNSHPQ